jgi:hypothetical protein
LPEKQSSFYKATEKYILDLFRLRCHSDTKYFLDKTPRYYLTVPFLAKVFPSAKFILLYRSPLEVLSSIISSWLDNRLFLYRYHVDLYYGPKALAESKKLLGERSYSILYNDLVNEPEQQMKRICRYLEIDFDPSMTDNFNQVVLQGRMGDHIGGVAYGKVSTKSVSKWKSIMGTKYRKWYAKRYLNSIGSETLQSFSMSLEEVLKEIYAAPNIRGGNFTDMTDHLLSNLKRWVHVDYYKRFATSIHRHRSFFPYL